MQNQSQPFLFVCFFEPNQVLMVEVEAGAPCHASRHDRPPGHLGDPHAPGRPRSGPDQRGLPAAYWHLHPAGCSTRGYYSGDQTGEWEILRSASLVVIRTLMKPPVGVFSKTAVVVVIRNTHKTLALTHNHAAAQTWANPCFWQAALAGWVCSVLEHVNRSWHHVFTVGFWRS